MKRIFAALALGSALLSPVGACAQTQTAAPAAVAPAASAAPAAVVRPRLMIVRVFTTDIDRAERFYRTVFGYSAPQSFGPTNRMFGTPSMTAPSILLVQVQQARANGAFTVAVDDTAAVLAAAEANGGTVTMPANSSGHGMPIGFLRDPDGTEIELIQLPSVPPAAH